MSDTPRPSTWWPSARRAAWPQATCVVLGFLAGAGATGAQDPDEPCADAAARVAAVETARRGFASADGARQVDLSDCDVPTACGPLGDAAADRCVTALTPTTAGFVVAFAPRPRDGVPAMLEAQVDAARGIAGVLRVGGSRWAVGAGLALVGETERVRHLHAGAAARVAKVRVRARNDSGAARPVSSVRAFWVHGGRATRLRSVRITPRSIPAGSSVLELSFAPRDAYQTFADEFAVRAELVVAGRTLRPVAEVAVTRVEPRLH